MVRKSISCDGTSFGSARETPVEEVRTTAVVQVCMDFKAPSAFEWFPAVKADVAFIVCLCVNAFPPQDFSCARVTSFACLTLDGF